MSRGHVAGWFVASVVLAFAAWLVFVGNLSVQDLALGAAAAGLSSLLSALVFKQMGIPLRVRFSDAVQICWTPWYLISGASVILLVLFKDLLGVKRAQSLYRAAPFECPTGRRGFVRRAFAVIYTTVTPNFIVIGIDASQRLMLFFQLERSGIPKMTRNLGAGA
jgi:NADH:ubiquinone oxidoreductase subunit 3 (subunit A)